MYIFNVLVIVVGREVVVVSRLALLASWHVGRFRWKTLGRSKNNSVIDWITAIIRISNFYLMTDYNDYSTFIWPIVKKWAA